MALFGKGRKDAAPRAWISALEGVLAEMPAPKQLVDYVLTGRDPGALSSPGPLQWLAHSHDRGGLVDHDALTALYAGFGEIDASVLRRWGRVLETAFGSGQWGLSLGSIRGGRWLELMINQAAATAPTGPLPISFADLERIAAEDGAGATEVLTSVFALPQFARYASKKTRQDLHRVPGFGDALTAHRTVVAQAITDGSVDERVAAAAVLEEFDAPTLATFADALAEASTGGSQTVRDAMRPLLARVAADGVSPLRALATQAKPDQRAHALELLASMPDQRGWAMETAAADRAASVRAVAGRAEAASKAPPVDDLAIPEPAPLPHWALPEEEAQQIAEEVIDTLADYVHSHNHQAAQQRQRHPQTRAFRAVRAPGKSEVRELARALASDEPVSRPLELDLPEFIRGSVDSVVYRNGLSAATAVQVMAALQMFSGPYSYQRYASVLGRVHDQTGQPDLTTLAAMLDAVGQDGRELVWRSFSASWGDRLGRGWPDDQVWPFVARNLDWILEHRGSRDGWAWASDDQAIFAAVATFPHPPAALVDHIYAMALGSRKGDRRPAQDALARDAGRGTRAAAALGDGKSDVRLVAAQWLTRIADPSTLPALQAAWKKERQDVVRGALLDALVAVGEDAATYLDPASTTATAEKLVAKGLPPALSWLDGGAVPEVTWAASGSPVPRVVVEWLCAVAVKAKSPEPDAVLRHYAALFDAPGRERLATHLLTAWLREDVRPIPPAEAEQQAAQNAAGFHRWYSTSPDSPYFGMTVEQLTAAILPAYLRRPAGSAIASKGLLAVVAACGGREVVPVAERFLREWYGQRAAQGKALIGMLAWVDHPSATQLVLSIGSRFRTKSFQDEAVRQAEALAERKGWTVDELADRTIPTAGFDDDGTLDLPYGPRSFSARLRPDLTVELHDPDGKVIKSLPTPRQTDDADTAKESKKAFMGAKKELKGIATLQTQRLYEAMCTERSWSVADWQRYLLGHPVVGPAVRRLVWVATPRSETDAERGTETVFRPLDDGSLTDVDDNEVTLPADGRVRIAHDSIVDAHQVNLWSEHLADYEVTPLFEQLGRGIHPVTSEMRSQRELTDFQGHLLQAFSLRGRAGKLGYTRGQSEDGGWFFTYDKRFPTLGITATVGFTGNGLPEENRTVALTTLTFRRELDGQRVELTLGDVPAVLVSECWHDVRLMAADGTGFDPDWSKKTEY